MYIYTKHKHTCADKKGLPAGAKADVEATNARRRDVLKIFMIVVDFTAFTLRFVKCLYWH